MRLGPKFEGQNSGSVKAEGKAGQAGFLNLRINPIFEDQAGVFN
jgi:hypothetical protein